jgi:hypothetical protein
VDNRSRNTGNITGVNSSGTDDSRCASTINSRDAIKSTCNSKDNRKIREACKSRDVTTYSKD